MQKSGRFKTVHDELESMRVVRGLVGNDVVNKEVVLAVLDKHFSDDIGRWLVLKWGLMKNFEKPLVIRRPVGREQEVP